MFTGIVEEVGEVHTVTSDADVVRLEIAASVAVKGVQPGDSIAVSGVCLTAVEIGADTVTVELVPETLRRSSLAAVAAGTRVNLERALVSGGRLGGHIVQGHVDGVASVLACHTGERTAELTFELPEPLARYVVEKGSITVDGVSLTVASVSSGQFLVALVPITLARTTLGERREGDRVNIEVDVLAKYVERLLSGYLPAPGQGASGSVRYAQEGEGIRSECLHLHG
ncbi:MAG: riboflavin synthase [Pseudonocardia sp.]|nr:riboflavin synthase [Pseudonocardia sp.]